MSRFQGILKVEVESDSDRQQWRETLCILDTKDRCLRVYHPDRKQLIRMVSIDKDTKVYDVANSKSLRIQWFSFYIVWNEHENKDNPADNVDADPERTPSSTGESILYFAAASINQKRNWLEALCAVVNEAIRLDYTTRLHNSLPLQLIHQPEIMVSNAAFFYSEKFLKVNYNGNDLESGAIMRPSSVKDSPGVRFQFPISTSDIEKERYSLIMVDLDADLSRGHQKVDDVDRYYLCWCILNMEESDFATGKEVVRYESPAPNIKSGLHRCLFLLFRHNILDLDNRQRDPSLTTALQMLLTHKERFPYLQWAKLMGLKDPMATAGFYTGWEKYHCDYVHNSLRYTPPEAYRSPYQLMACKYNDQNGLYNRWRSEVYDKHSLGDIFQSLGKEAVEMRNSDAGSISICTSLETRTGSSSGAVAGVGGSQHSGVTLRPSALQKQPVVTISLPVTMHRQLEDEHRVTTTGSSTRYYTLVLTDPDTPSALKPTQKESVHWVLVNIPDGDTMAQGVAEVLPYTGPAPMFASGMHRFVMSLYEQKSGKMSDWDVYEARNFFTPRLGLRVHDWVLSMSSYFTTCVPLALFVVMTEWEDAVDAYHLALGLMPAARFRSPSQATMFLKQSKERSAQVVREKEELPGAGVEHVSSHSPKGHVASLIVATADSPTAAPVELTTATPTTPPSPSSVAHVITAPGPSIAGSSTPLSSVTLHAAPASVAAPGTPLASPTNASSSSYTDRDCIEVQDDTFSAVDGDVEGPNSDSAFYSDANIDANADINRNANTDTDSSSIADLAADANDIDHGFASPFSEGSVEQGLGWDANIDTAANAVDYDANYEIYTSGSFSSASSDGSEYI